MAALFKSLSDQFKTAWNADVPCWFDYLHNTADK